MYPTRKRKQISKNRKTRRGGNMGMLRELPKAAPLVPIRSILSKQQNHLARCDILSNKNDRQRCHDRCNGKPKSCIDEFWG
jgi:hypothetical protein